MLEMSSDRFLGKGALHEARTAPCLRSAEGWPRFFIIIIIIFSFFLWEKEK